MSRRDAWQEVYRRFDPERPAGDPRSDARWLAPRERSPVEAILEKLNLPMGTPRVLMTGTTGTGKSTELLRVAHAQAGRDFVVHLDLHQHFSEVVGDVQALRDVSPWEVVFLAGLAVIRACADVLPYDLPRDYVSDLGAAWSSLAERSVTPPPAASIDIPSLAKAMIVGASAAVPLLGAAPATAAAAMAGLKWLEATTGAARWLLPLGRGQKAVRDQDPEVKSLLRAVNLILGYVQTKSRRVLVLLDGLDRIVDFDRAKTLFLDSNMIAQLECPTVVVGPFALRSHIGAAAVRGFRVFTLANEPVLDKRDPGRHGAGVAFLRDVFERRTADIGGSPLVPRALVERLAYYSGGRARDFVRFVRMLAEHAWAADAEEATEALVKRVLEEARLLLEAGLDKGHVALLEEVAADPAHDLPADERARELLSYGQLLPYPNDSWFYPHPLLTLHRVRTSRAGSTG